MDMQHFICLYQRHGKVKQINFKSPHQMDLYQLVIKQPGSFLFSDNFEMKILILFFARFAKLTYSKDIVKKIDEFCILENGNPILYNRTCPALALEIPQDSELGLNRWEYPR